MFYPLQGSVETPDKEPETKTPVRRAQRGDSIDSLGGLSPTDTTNIQCKNVPANLNKKDILEKHFARFGKICRIMCRPQKNLATVHFQDHVRTDLSPSELAITKMFAYVLHCIYSKLVKMIDGTFLSFFSYLTI